MAAAAANTAEDVPPNRSARPALGRKKRILFAILALLSVLVIATVALVLVARQRAAAAAVALEGGAPALAAPADERAGRHGPPTFVPLEQFVVNLSDKDSERFAQIGITLEVDNAEFAEQVRAYMPAIRNGVLMILAHKRSAELMERTGKEALAAEIRAEVLRTLGMETGASSARPADARLRHVHFSSFLIQ